MVNHLAAVVNDIEADVFSTDYYNYFRLSKITARTYNYLAETAISDIRYYFKY
jgi:hypothetical protein